MYDFDFNNVKPDVVDTDFRKWPQYVMGDLGPKPETLGTMRAYEDAFPTLIHPRSQWEQIAKHLEEQKAGLEYLITRIFNQGREGSCVGNMEAQMHQVVQAKMFGKERVTELSASSAYQLIGSSPGSGANVSDAMRKGCAVGIIPLDTPENRARFGNVVMPHTGFYERRPAGWEKVAMELRFDEVFVIRTLEGLVSAQLNLNPVGVGRQGHSILYTGIRYRSGKPCSLYPNSWSLDWGFAAGGHRGGFGLDTERQMAMSAGWAFTARTVVVPSWNLAA